MEQCFICKKNDVEKKAFDTYFTYNCSFCGHYGIDEDLHDSAIMDGEISYVENGITQLIKLEEFYSQAPSIAAGRKLKGMDKYLLVYDSSLNSCQNRNSKFTPIGLKAFWEEYPQDAIDMLNRVLVNLGRLITHPAEMFVIHPQIGGKNAYFYSKDIDSTRRICHQLEALEWINVQQTGSSFIVSILPKGWLTLRELNTSKDSDKAFLAMWFSKEDKQLGKLRDAVKKAVKQAGYICEVVDEIHHNDYIMDKVLNLIKDSRFVIADFTSAPEDIEDKGKIPGGVRGGVYYEAGFAKGLGRPVIVSCRKDKDSESRIHFDIVQLSTIFWKQNRNKLTTPDGLDFVEFMKERIIATVGKGKHYKEQLG